MEVALDTEGPCSEEGDDDMDAIDRILDEETGEPVRPESVAPPENA